MNKNVVKFPNAELIPAIVEMLHEGHNVKLRLRGFSMRPFLEDDRDIALLTLPRHYAVGDPILAEIGPGHYVLHRLVKQDGKQLTLLGDGNLTYEHCTTDDVRATILGFYRKGRDKIDLITGRKWRVYSWVWTHLFPVRRYLLAFYRRIWIPLLGTI